MDVDLSQDGSSSQDDNQREPATSLPDRETLGRGVPEASDKEAVAAAIAELDKMEKFKFQGKEWTPKDLEKAILRQQDYTKKTQSLAEERKSFESERKFAENLHYDLQYVRSNPTQATINEFIKLYPEKYHGALKTVLTELQSANREQMQPTEKKTETVPNYDIETANRLNKLETFYHEQEVAKNTAQINATIEKYSKQYPDAISRLVIADVYEAHNQGVKVTEQVWEDAFKAVDAQMKEVVKSKYGDLVKKQTEANNKARDVEPGGGTIGRAPAKFKSLADVTKYAIEQETSRRS